MLWTKKIIGYGIAAQRGERLLPSVNLSAGGMLKISAGESDVFTNPKLTPMHDSAYKSAGYDPITAWRYCRGNFGVPFR